MAPRWLAVAVATVAVTGGLGVHGEPSDCAPDPSTSTAMHGNTTAFAACISNYSAPVRFCQFCKEKYSAYRAAYSDLSSSCQNFGSFQVFDSTFQSLWEQGGCDDCDTDTMGELQGTLEALQECLTSMTNRSFLCTTCKPFYTKVTDMYAKAPGKCQNTVDVIDAYRRGLSVWAQHDCPVPIPGKEPALIILGLVCFWVIVFYTLSRLLVRMPAEFYFGKVERPTSPSRSLDDTPDIHSQYFERTGPGLTKGLHYDEPPPEKPSLYQVLAQRRRARDRKAEAADE